jgi:hypothetical protein
LLRRSKAAEAAPLAQVNGNGPLSYASTDVWMVAVVDHGTNIGFYKRAHGGDRLLAAVAPVADGETTSPSPSSPRATHPLGSTNFAARVASAAVSADDQAHTDPWVFQQKLPLPSTAVASGGVMLRFRERPAGSAGMELVATTDSNVVGTWEYFHRQGTAHDTWNVCDVAERTR